MDVGLDCHRLLCISEVAGFDRLGGASRETPAASHNSNAILEPLSAPLFFVELNPHSPTSDWPYLLSISESP